MLAPLMIAAALAQAPEAPKARDDSFRPDPSWKPLDKETKGLWFDPEGRRLILRAKVALREGFLEHLLCREQTKEHESILSSPVPPRLIHAGLLLTGAEKGHAVRFRPEFKPPTGSPIRIVLEWVQDGKAHRADARTWVKDEKSGKALDVDWVFAGSDLYRDPESGETRYAADGGDVITVSNFVTAMLDVPIASSASDDARSFAANTPEIPPVGTPVTLYLSPVRKAEGKEGRPAAKARPKAAPGR